MGEEFNKQAVEYTFTVPMENIKKILDSGERTEFESGAVRDVQAGKGRCDLLPLDVAAEFLIRDWSAYTLNREPMIALDMFGDTHDIKYIYLAVFFFCIKRGWDKPTMLLEVSKHFEDGCRKYGERNWEKGIPLSRYIDSGIRHYLKWLRRDDDEPHDRAFCWNMLCLCWTFEHVPECNDLG